MLKVLRDKWSVRQKGIVLLVARILVILAGAGAGKTTVLAERMAYLIRRGIMAAENVFLTTFSRKAAAMLNARIRQAAGVDVHASTIHSLAYEVILSSGGAGTDTKPEVLDERAQYRIVERVLKNHPARNALEPGVVVAKISWWKAHGFSVTDLRRLYPSDPRVGVFALYEKTKGPALDYCDLITKASAILESDATVRQAWHGKVKGLAIDELQDTNPLELRFLKLVASPEALVFAVGDPDQAIYAFQGADLTNSLHFDRYFPGAILLTLTENRRSTSTILACAQRLIEHNKDRYPKALVPTRSAGCPVMVVEAGDQQEECEFVAAQIRAAIISGVPCHEIAILARTRAIVESYAAFLKGKGLEVARHRYDQDFWTKPAVERAVAAIAAIAGIATTHDWDILLAHLPQADRLAVLHQAQEQHCEVQALSDAGTLAQAAITHVGRGYITKLLAALGQLRQQPLHNTGMTILQLRQPLGIVEGKGSEAAIEITEDLHLFAEAVADLSRQPGVTSFQRLHDRLVGSSIAGEKISVLTAHTAKGLEFSWLFVVGCEEGLFPHHYATNTNTEDMEEERRLFYVAMTRAKDRLFLLHTVRRRQGKAVHRMYKSRFLTEVGQDGVERIDACTFLKAAPPPTSPCTSTAP